MALGHHGDNGVTAMLAVVLESKREFVSVPILCRSTVVTTAVYPDQPTQKPKNAQDHYVVVRYFCI